MIDPFSIFGSLAPGAAVGGADGPMNILPGVAQTPGTPVGAINGQAPAGQGFDQAKMQAALKGLQGTFGGNDPGPKPMAPMQLHRPQFNFGMLNGF